MRNLDLENPSIAKPQNFASLIAALPFMLGACCSFIAAKSAPQLELSNNPLFVFCVGVCVVSFFLIIIPKIYRWGWKSQYFGASLLYVGSVSLIGVVPWMGMVLYSNLPLWARLFLFVSYGLPVIWWCRRFVHFYRNIYATEKLRNILYCEDDDAVYYLQKGDKWLIEKKFRFEQAPGNIFSVVSIILAVSTLPFMGKVTHYLGVPFPHIFLTVLCLPIVLVSLGLATRGYLIFYFYPWKLKQETGKDVYVDMASPAPSRRSSGILVTEKKTTKEAQESQGGGEHDRLTNGQQ